MLYIFHVDTGRMITFDMSVALENVQFLKETIEQLHRLPASSQVLLVSGGEMLQAQNRVCSYSAGTDTNPIYMFSTTIIESKNPPQPWPSIEPDTDMKEQVDRCLTLPANYNTVVKRAQVAQQIYEMAKEENKICEKLVHEQHLQQQGWAAVVANMEDITEEFKERCNNFHRCFSEVLERRDEYLTCLKFFNDDLDKLSSIPILPALTQNAEKPFHAFDEFYSDNDSFPKPTPVDVNEKNPNNIRDKVRGKTPEITTGPSIATGTSSATSSTASTGTTTATTTTSSTSGTVPPGPMTVIRTESSTSELQQQAQQQEQSTEKILTLLQWISASENQISLRKMAAECLKGLEQFDAKEMEKLKMEFQSTIDAAQQDNMKEIKGLEDRLCGLEKLMYDVKKLVQEQSELAQAFQQNQNRANNLGDASILPDLCASHRSQMVVMLKNHKNLRDIRRRIAKAKEELGLNLFQRLKFIIYIENRMYEIDSKLLFIHRNCRRLQGHMGIIEQIHQAPSMYVTAVTEVVRRRNFSSAFLMWASDLACHLLAIYNDEVMRRQDFSAMFEGHFLSTLFPGMNDMPPSYATEAPSIFDSSLPNLTKNDINLLSRQLPDITSKIELPDLGAVIEFFSSRSGSKSQEKSSLSDAGRTTVADGEQTSTKALDMHAHLKDYERGFESETDTEEFEKVGQSPIDRRRTSAGGTIQTYTTLASSTQTSLIPAATNQSLKPETCSTSTSTEVILTQSMETITESQQSSPVTPKKPGRVNKILPTMKSLDSTHSLTYSNASTLPSIPEIFSPSQCSSVNENADAVESETSESSPDAVNIDVTNTLGHHYNHLNNLNYHHHHHYLHYHNPQQQQQNNSYLSQQQSFNNNNKLNKRQQTEDDIDSEFINSEFYIDESLPSSLNSDRQDENVRDYKKLLLELKYDNSCSDDSNKGDITHLSDENNLKHDLQTVILLLQDNLGSTRIEVERLKGLLKEMYNLSQESINTLKYQLKNVKTQSECDKNELQNHFEKLNDAWNRIQIEASNHEQELIKRTVDYEFELNDVKKSLDLKNDEIQTLVSCKTAMEQSQADIIDKCEQAKIELLSSNEKLAEKIKYLEKELAKSGQDKEKAIKEITERLNRDHKTDIESLRCRFKLMTSIERSPSDTSLEKIERPDLFELSVHEALYQQTKDEMIMERGLAIKSATERAKSHQLGGGSPKSPSKTQDFFKRILEDKDNQIEMLRVREDQFLKDINRYKETIQNLTDSDLNETSMLKFRLDNLLKDKTEMEQELEKEKNKVLEMETSFAALKITPSETNILDVTPPPVSSSTATETTSASPDSTNNSKMLASSVSTGKSGNVGITIDSCSKGDTVLIVWNSAHDQYIVVQDVPTLYFLHAESYSALNLPPLTAGNGPPKITHFIGRVFGKEYCQARKDENRYKVTKGTKFYRVRVRPRSPSRSGDNNKKSKENDGISQSTITPSTSTEKCTQPQLLLMDSFAQTDTLVPLIEDSSKDMVDSGVDAQQKSIYKERNISVTEEDESISLSDERCKYISVSEEDEAPIQKVVQLTSDQDDSDEYRSLESKDDADIPL